MEYNTNLSLSCARADMMWWLNSSSYFHPKCLLVVPSLSPVVLPSNASLHLFSCFSKLAPSLCETSFNKTPSRCLLTSETTRASNPLFARNFAIACASNWGLVNFCVPYQSKVLAPNVLAMKVKKSGRESRVDRTIVRQSGEASQMKDILLLRKRRERERERIT